MSINTWIASAQLMVGIIAAVLQWWFAAKQSPVLDAAKATEITAGTASEVDQAASKREAKERRSTLVWFIVGLVASGSGVVSRVFASAPVTRIDVFLIALYCSIVVMLLAMRRSAETAEVMRDMVNLIRKLMETTEETARLQNEDLKTWHGAYLQLTEEIETLKAPRPSIVKRWRQRLKDWL